VSSIGTEFIDRFAGGLKDLAVQLFGTNDKPALIVGIIINSLMLGALFGLVARRWFWLGAIGFAGFGAVGLWAYTRDPLGSTTTGLLAAVIAVAVGVASLWALLRVAPRRAAVTDRDADHSDAHTGTRRRTFLAAALVAIAGAAGSSVLGRKLRAGNISEAARADVALPRAGTSAGVPDRQPFSPEGLSPYVTPNAEFYRIDTALIVPQVDIDAWSLEISGMVDSPFSISYDELLEMESVEETVTLQCVSNEVGGRLVDNAVWQGVPLQALLDRAGVQAGATQVVGRSLDDFTAGFPTDVALDGRVALVAYAMNGEPLPVEHGFPARLVVAGLYGYVSATKWLRQIELTSWEDFDGYWITRGWAKEGPIKTMSRIDVPASSARLAAGPTPVAGVAWAPTRGIERVEVQIDDGEWQECRLGEVASDNTWVQWLYEWDARPGEHTIRARATDRGGETQTDAVEPPIPSGATGWHSRRVRVTG